MRDWCRSLSHAVETQLFCYCRLEPVDSPGRGGAILDCSGPMAARGGGSRFYPATDLHGAPIAQLDSGGLMEESSSTVSLCVV